MASKVKENEGRNPRTVPSQEDEADILEEVEAEQDEETGQMMASEEKVRELGALDPESVRRNRHVASVADKKRKGEKVSFGIEDPIAHYDAILRVWSNDKVEIRVQNLVTREQHIIKAQPRSGGDLYKLLEGIHGQRDLAEYKVEFVGALRKEYIGNARIVMPDARVPGQQGVWHTPQPQQAPQGPAPAPQVPTFAMPSQGGDPMQMVQQVLDIADRLRMQTAPSVQAAPAQPPPMAPGDPMQMVQQVLDIADRLRMQAAPAQQPQAPLPPPPPASDPTALLDWALRVVQKLQPQAVQHQAVQPQPQIAAPTGMPPFAPPPGTTWVYVPNAGWIAQALGGAVGVGGEPPPRRSPFARPEYYPHSDPRDPRHTPPQPQRQQSPAQAFRDALSTARELHNVSQQFSAVFGGGEAPDTSEVAEDDDSPIKIIDTGHGKIAVNKSDGALRWAETGLMVIPGVLKWMGEQHDKIQAARREQQEQRQRPPAQRLPPGYVRVDEHFKPPPGFVPVPVAEDELPEPPVDMPPPVASEEGRQAAPPGWGAPTIPQNG